MGMTDSSDLYYMRARFYSPAIRRFINQDILHGDVAEGQTLNQYAYVTGQPVSFIDPFGLSAVAGVWPIAGGAALFDGPLPIGDIVAIIFITGAIIYDAATDDSSECRCNDQESYYHYTSKANLELILASQQLLSSSGSIYARHGSGQYFTEISPEMIAATTISQLTPEQIKAGKISLGQLGHRLFGSAIRIGKKFEAFIEVDLTGCNVINPLPFIYLVPNNAPLDLRDRIIRFGEVVLP
jgi:RHS repeat-associated protein